MIQTKQKQKLQIAIKKARGILEKLSQMIEDEKYCIEIAQQINAVMGLLRSANLLILESHLQTCGAKRLGSKKKKVRDEFVGELIRALDISSRK